MKRVILALLLLLPVSGQGVIMTFYIGSELLGSCEAYLDGNYGKGNSCADYVMGIYDAHDTFITWGDIKPRWCPPKKMESKQLVRVVTEWLQGNPDKVHFGASGLVRTALMQAFPCP